MGDCSYKQAQVRLKIYMMIYKAASENSRIGVLVKCAEKVLQDMPGIRALVKV